MLLIFFYSILVTSLFNIEWHFNIKKHFSMFHLLVLFVVYVCYKQLLYFSNFLQIITDASVPSTSLADAFKRSFPKHEDSFEVGNVGHAHSAKAGASSSKLNFLSRISSK